MVRRIVYIKKMLLFSQQDAGLLGFLLPNVSTSALRVMNPTLHEGTNLTRLVTQTFTLSIS